MSNVQAKALYMGLIRLTLLKTSIDSGETTLISGHGRGCSGKNAHYLLFRNLYQYALFVNELSYFILTVLINYHLCLNSLISLTLRTWCTWCTCSYPCNGCLCVCFINSWCCLLLDWRCDWICVIWVFDSPGDLNFVFFVYIRKGWSICPNSIKNAALRSSCFECMQFDIKTQQLQT